MAQRNFRELIESIARPEQILAHLNGLGNAERISQVTALDRKHMVRLWEVVSGAWDLDINHFVPSEVDPLTEIIHWGKNSLPAFRRFQKRFCRPTPEATELWGYNEQLMRKATGPGYFVTHASGQESEPIWINYTRLPEGKAPQWPSIVPNSGRLGRFVYHGTVDKMRRVSEHVSIGAAFKKERPMGAYFMLCRDGG